MVDTATGIALLGILGGIITEALRIAAYLRETNAFPGLPNLVASIVYAAFGAGVLLYGVEERSYLETAQLGAAFPLLWSAGVRALTPPPENGGVTERAGAEPSWLEYAAFRFR